MSSCRQCIISANSGLQVFYTMSNKYNYKRASHDVYDILNYDSMVLDDITKQMANDYLLKSR